MQDYSTEDISLSDFFKELPDQASTLSSREAASDFTARVSLNLAHSLSQLWGPLQ